jgi:hypothetical protein
MNDIWEIVQKFYWIHGVWTSAMVWIKSTPRDSEKALFGA